MTRTDTLVQVFVLTAHGKVADGVGQAIGTELVVHHTERVLNTPSWFRITHVATGTRVATYRSRRLAMQAAKRVAAEFEAMPGCSDTITLRSHLVRRKVPQQLRACQGFVY